MVEIGDKVTIRTGKDGRLYATKSGVPEVGDKILRSPEKRGRYIAHKSGVPEIGDKVLVVPGNDGRSYAVVSGGGGRGCLIDLHRFALVYGSTTLSPVDAITVYYADNYPYKQCGHTYQGYLTLFFVISGTTAIGIVEIRICKNDPNRIVIETYGDVAPTIAISLWFNKGTEQHFPDFLSFPETGIENVLYIDDETSTQYIWTGEMYEEGNLWVKLNSTGSGTKMAYAQTSYVFKETIRDGSIYIDCCKKCPDTCGCKTCNITSRFTISRNPFNITGYMVEHLTGNVGYSTLYIKWNNITIFEVSTPIPGSTLYTSPNINISEPAYYAPEDYPEHLLPPRDDPSKNACYIICNNTYETSITDYCYGWVEYNVVDNQIYFSGKFIFEAGDPYNPDNYGPEYTSPTYTATLPFEYTGAVVLFKSKYNYGLNNLGTETLLYYWDGYGRKVSIFIEYKFSCDTIYLWIYTDENSPSMYVLITYLDDLSISHELYKGPVKNILI